ncbi:MAG: hypothetical protein CSB13_00155 [Chloroflexi bacterium]|nr:MAG: hypothetical protein CSB13_00155 [Chloroflexota bacterium]
MESDSTVSQAKRTGSEWVLVLVVTLVVLVVTAVPYFLAYTTTQPGLVFSGTLMNPEDSQTYFGKMLQGYDGHWLYTITFTAEPHEPTFLGGFYFLLGHIARWTGMSLAFMWHLGRALSVVGLMVAAYGFIAYFVAERRTRMIAYLLAVFGAGLGWLLFAFGQTRWLDARPIDFHMLESHLFFMSLTFPHIILSTTLLMGSFWCVLQAYAHKGQPKGWGFAVAASVLNLCLGILHPLLIYLIVLTGSLYWLLLAWRARKILWYEGFVLVVAYALPGLLYLYYGYSLLTNEILRGWDANRSETVSPAWPHFIISFGPYLLLALIYRIHQWRQKQKMSANELFLWGWVLATALLIYAPLNSQRRFIQGVHIPLSILTAAGFIQVIVPWFLATKPVRKLLQRERYTEVKLGRLITITFLLFMALSHIYIVASVTTSSVIHQPDLLFRSVDEMDAAQWLRAENSLSPGPILLGEAQTGNLVAGQAGNQVVVGHWAETIHYGDKVEEVAQFYASETEDEWRRDLLEKYHVTYVWYGPREQGLGAFSPETAVYLQPVYQNDTITIYTVVE